MFRGLEAERRMSRDDWNATLATAATDEAKINKNGSHRQNQRLTCVSSSSAGDGGGGGGADDLLDLFYLYFFSGSAGGGVGVTAQATALWVTLSVIYSVVDIIAVSAIA